MHTVIESEGQVMGECPALISVLSSTRYSNHSRMDYIWLIHAPRRYRQTAVIGLILLLDLEAAVNIAAIVEHYRGPVHPPKSLWSEH